VPASKGEGKLTRSEMMARVGQRNTRPEMAVRSALHRSGFRFRLHRTDLPGRPDIVLKRLQTVIFVHGCFWHQHAACRRAARPKSNVEFWDAKLARNTARDEAVIRQLEASGWRSVIVWECELRELGWEARLTTTLTLRQASAD
jgi:DNA mismatch endonuclease (patch repair protein)